MALQRVPSIIKPDTVSKNVIGEILTRFEKVGLRVVVVEMVQPSEREAGGFYAEYKGRPLFKDLVSFTTSGPVVVQVLEGEDAIARNRELMGATDPKKADAGTIRADFVVSIDENAVHGSDSEASAAREIAYFFATVEVCKCIRRSNMGEGEAMITTTTGKVNLLGLTQSQLEQLFESIDKGCFRAGQVMKWIHHFDVDDFDAMTNVGKALHEKFKASAEIRGPEIVNQDISTGGTRKWVVRVASSSCVETVYIPQGGRDTLCVSSQAGCALDRSFYSTGKQGLNSDLATAEVIGQVWIANKSLGIVSAKIDRVITNVVMVGMGESPLNFDNVVAAMNTMMDDLGYGISKRKVALSTSGVVPMIDKFGEVTDVSLALSLHVPNDELRNKLVPINKKYLLGMLLDACRRYISRFDEKRALTVEYTLLRDVNDQPEHAEQMIALLKDMPCKTSLISFNPFPHFNYERPSNNVIRRFQDMLHKGGFNVTVRTTRGDDIDAACGQLVGQVMDRIRRSERYIAVRQLAKSGSVANRN